jgi:branched-chain amino acid transport system ATP-binding protein
MTTLTIEELYADDPVTRRSITAPTLTVRERDLCLIFGNNGAGKSLLLRSIAGLVPHQGSVMLGRRRIESLPAAQRARAGIVLISPTLGNFPPLTVDENLRLATHVRASETVSATQQLTRLYGWFPELYQQRRERASSLPRLGQLHLALARGLALTPRVLLLDEISYGLNDLEWHAVVDLLSWIRWSFRPTVVMAEARPARGWDLADWVCVLEAGRIIASAPPASPPTPPERPRPAQAAAAVHWKHEQVGLSTPRRIG